MRKQKILVYGGSGLVGSELIKTLSCDFEVKAPTHADVDLERPEDVKNNIAAIKPDHIVYTAGITKIDDANRQPELAFLLNAEAPRIISEFAAPRRIPVHYLSTNAVFNGQQSDRPYREDDKPSPLSVYGKSKLRGERHIIQASPLNSVLRTVMPYSTSYQRKKDFTRITLESLQQGKQIPGIVDQIINPIYVKTLVRAIKKILTEGANGTYHLAAVDWISNYEFAKKVARAFGFSEAMIIPTTLRSFYKHKPGSRTPYYWLDSSKFRKKFGGCILHAIDGDLALFREDYFSFRRNTSTGTRVTTSKA